MPEATFSLAPAAECITPWAPGEAALDYVASLGCDCLQLDFTQFPSGIDFTGEEARDLAEALRRRGLRGRTLSAWPEGLTPTAYADFLKRIAQVAPTLGLEVMNTYIWPFLGADDEASIAHYARALAPALDIAADNGLTITIEPEAHDLSRSVAGLQRILAGVAHPALKINYDPCNLYHGIEEGFPYAYFELRDSIAYVHLKNGGVFREGTHPADEKGTPFAPPWQDRVIRWGPIDEGALDVGRIIDQLIEDGYDGVVALEPHAGGEEKRRRFFQAEVAFIRRRMASAGG